MLKLYYHPLASYCWKVLIALYENEIPFKKEIVDLGDQESRREFLKLAPMGQFPVLQDERGKRVISQSAVIIEYLSLHFAGPVSLVPENGKEALEVREWSEFFDQYIHHEMQRIVADRLRPQAQRDSFGVNQCQEKIRTAYAVIEDRMRHREWMTQAGFSMVDCAAAPALYYANLVEPLTAEHPSLRDYLERLQQRPSFARVLEEAQPYFHLFPRE